MVLMKVVRDDAMAILGFERHTFRCSACHETERRLVFTDRGRETYAEPLPVHPAPPLVPRYRGAGWSDRRSRSLRAHVCKGTFGRKQTSALIGQR